MPGIGLEYGIAGLLGEGLKGFADSYGAEKDRQRKQAEADDERAYRARKMEAEDFDSGRVWDPERKNYKAREGEGLLTKSEQKLLSGGLEARKAFGEDWYRKENEPLRTAVDALLRKQFGAQAAPTQSALPGGAGLMPREPDTAVAAPKSAGFLKPQTPRQKQIAETEALGSIPAAGSAPAQKPLAGASISNSPYEPLKKKVMARHDPSYGDGSQWGTYVPKAEREQRKKNQDDLLNIEMKELEKGSQKLPAGDALKLSEAGAFPQMFDTLEKSIDTHKGLMGPFAGRWNGNNPYNLQAQSFQAEIAADAQRVGKYLEGGVLRAEDVPKYAKMLPQMSDTPEAAKAKLKNVRTLIEQKIAADRQGLQSAGYNLGPEPTKAPQAPQAPYQPGQTIYIDGKPHKVSADGKSADPL